MAVSLIVMMVAVVAVPVAVMAVVVAVVAAVVAVLPLTVAVSTVAERSGGGERNGPGHREQGRKARHRDQPKDFLSGFL